MTGVAPDTITFNAAISAYGKGLQWKQALELMNQMRFDKVAPNTITLSAAISAFEKGLALDASVQLLSEIGMTGSHRTRSPLPQ